MCDFIKISLTESEKKLDFEFFANLEMIRMEMYGRVDTSTANSNDTISKLESTTIKVTYTLYYRVEEDCRRLNGIEDQLFFNLLGDPKKIQSL